VLFRSTEGGTWRRFASWGMGAGARGGLCREPSGRGVFRSRRGGTDDHARCSDRKKGCFGCRARRERRRGPERRVQPQGEGPESERGQPAEDLLEASGATAYM
ncbi:MAG: N-acetylmuramoyl-L-alanine amidase, partial [uncultured Rubrobacteraceae bacterium]